VSDRGDEELELLDEAVEHVAWPGETIDAADAMLERALAYGMYVNKGRAIPDVRDGLKPVQRRIVFSLDELGGRPGRPYIKSATVIGQVIGHYHPHGDGAVYDAMVRLAQDFNQNVPLVDGQGNWGSVGPKEFSDPPAAYRYTEARLTPAAGDWLGDLRPEVVEFRPNFSEKRQEPFVLPVTFPNLLVNGSKGIGWSMACEIPPHNLAEACAAAIVLAENPDATVADLLAVMPGPDFPTGGIVVDPDELPEAYARGQGTFRLQARFHVEQLPGNQQAIVVTELPYGVSPDQVVAEVVRAARADRIGDVTELPKNLSDRNGIRVQIRCKRGGNVTKLIADLMRTTSLRVTVGINMTVLVDGAPRQVGLLEAVDRFVAFRFEVVTRRLEHERAVLLEDLHRLVALLAALDAIDAVVAIIRGAEDDDDAREQLKARLTVRPHGSRTDRPIDDEQAQYILDMPLKRLSRLNRLRLQEERDKKGARVDEIGRTLDSFEALRDLVVGELRDAATKYGVPRRTLLGGEGGAPPAPGGRKSDLAVVAAPATPVWLFATRAGACATRAQDGRLQRAPLTVGAGDAVAVAIATDTRAELNAFSSDGLVYRLRVADVPIESRVSRGVRAIALARGAELAGLAPMEPEGGFLLLVTARGEVKRTEAAVFSASHMGGSAAIDMEAQDRLVAVVPHADGDEVVLSTAHGRALRIEAGKIRPVKSAGAGGVAGIRLAPGDTVVAATTAAAESLLIMHESGQGKLVPVAAYPTQGRGGGGVQSADRSTPKRDPAGPVAAVGALQAGAGAMVLTAAGGLAMIGAGVEPAGRATVSRRLLELAAGDEVTAVIPL
jgi:DNA gyrase subunit A